MELTNKMEGEGALVALAAGHVSRSASLALGLGDAYRHLSAGARAQLGGPWRGHCLLPPPPWQTLRCRWQWWR